MDDVHSKLTSLDYAILAELPIQGSKLGFRDLALQVKQIVTRLNAQIDDPAGYTNGNEIGGRMRALRFLGLVVDVRVTPVSDGKGFQVTETGKRVLNETD